MMSKVFTPNGGYAEVVQQSKCAVTGKVITTFSVKYGLIVHSEFLRHRMLSRGVKSNRAIPPSVIRSEVLDDPYYPIWFGANQSGMVAKSEVKYPKIAKALWLGARYPMVAAHWLGDKLLGAHKEWINRLLNPWQWVRETITATEWDNFYNLRIHPDAQQDIQVIAKAMYSASNSYSGCIELRTGQWHVPYVNRAIEDVGGYTAIYYVDNDGSQLSTEQALKASAARCARSSYDNHDKTKATIKGDMKLWDQLIESDPKHSSPVEHQGTPMDLFIDSEEWEVGITHIDSSGDKWSGNFCGWIQHRQLLDNHTCSHYEPK
jgi:thymidylate synthase ThyX